MVFNLCAKNIVPHICTNHPISIQLVNTNRHTDNTASRDANNDTDTSSQLQLQRFDGWGLQLPRR